MAGTRPSTSIARAIRRIETGATLKAIELLVGAWRKHRSDRLAALVERAARLVAAPVLPADPALAGDALIEALAALEPDPRFVPEVVAELARGWPRSRLSRRWAQVAELIVAHEDPRAARILAAAGADKDVRDPLRLIGESFARRLAVDPPAPQADIEDACAACEAALARAEQATRDGARRGAALLAAIHAEPDDLALRAIYADWLVEQGDPRGEYITLALLPSPTDPQRARMAELLGAHRERWLGGIADACVAHVWFEHGFVAGATIDPARALARRGDPAWSTVTTLHLLPSNAPLSLAPFADPEFAALEHVGGLTQNQLGLLLRDREELDLAGLTLGFQLAINVADLYRVLTVVDHYRLAGFGLDARTEPTALAPLWRDPRAARISTLQLRGPLASLVDWRVAVPATVTTLVLATQGYVTGFIATLRRDATGELADLALVYRGTPGNHTAPLAPILDDVVEAFAPGTLTRFALRLADARLGAAERARLAAALAARHPHATVAV